jgi:hypothetical protein
MIERSRHQAERVLGSFFKPKFSCDDAQPQLGNGGVSFAMPLSGRLVRRKQDEAKGFISSDTQSSS